MYRRHNKDFSHFAAAKFIIFGYFFYYLKGREAREGKGGGRETNIQGEHLILRREKRIMYGRYLLGWCRIYNLGFFSAQ